MNRGRGMIDMVGQRFGKLVVKCRAPSSADTKWLCVCDCGGQVVRRGVYLRAGKHTCCGCVTPSRKGRRSFAGSPAEARAIQAAAKVPVKRAEVIDCRGCGHRHPWSIACPWCTGRVRGFVADGPLIGLPALDRAA